MIRLGTLFWLLLVSATAAAMFMVKYQVQDLEEQLARTARATAREQHEIRMLTAEWAYLNRPEGLAAMNQRYLSLIPIPTKQLQTQIADIPLRPPTAPGPEGDAVLAGAAPAGAGALPVVPAVAQPPEVAAAQAKPALIKSALIKTASHAEPAPPARSLDELFARITTSRR